MYFSTALIKDLIDYASLEGLSFEKLSKKYQQLLAQKHIDYKKTVDVLNYFSELLKDDNLGLHLGEKISLMVAAYVNSIMQYSETLEEAFDNAVKYSVQISDALESSLLKKGAHYTLCFEENPNWKVYSSYARRQILDLTLLSALKSISTYTNKKYYPLKVHFSYPKPRNLKEHFRLFNCHLQFNQTRNEIFFEKQIFKNSTEHFDSRLLESLIKKIEIEIKNLKPENEIIYQLKKCILHHKPARISIKQAAESMHLSKRSLQRKLKDSNTTFKKIESALLLNLSKTYLEENEKSIEEVSYLLGFSESSAFIRFFNSQVNQTPLSYKKQKLNN